MPAFINIAAYKFAHLAELKRLRDRLLAVCNAGGLKGTVLLSSEGINLFVAGAEPQVATLIAELRAIRGLEDLEPKVSESAHQPFNRMLVRIKKEIIAFGVEGIDPASRPSPKISATTLKQWLDEGRPITLLDTRNDYEVKLGTFRGARHVAIDHFREFPAAVRQLPSELKEQPIVMFCTGGIRCEKAGPFMEREGFGNIFQLDGGILKYFEECGGAHYDGECFVFDQRVGVDPALRETESRQCFNCQTPLSRADQQDPRFVPNVSCPYCARPAKQQMEQAIAVRQAAIRRVTSPLPGSVPYENRRPVTIPLRCDGATLLPALCEIFPHIERDEWLARCNAGRLTDGHGVPATAGTTVRAGERYVQLFPVSGEPDVSSDVRIIHEDEAIIVLHKPAPLPMHPSGRFNRNTLQFILSKVYAPEKPRHAHRLDANTTGLVVFARNRRIATELQRQFAGGEVEKLYFARVLGTPLGDAFVSEAPISELPGELGSREVDEEDGRSARTEFRVVERSPDGTTLLEVRPLTGRTNQIRVHLWQLGFPICGDATYLPDRQLGNAQTLPLNADPVCLHAQRITFTHPFTKARVTFEDEVPAWAAT